MTVAVPFRRRDAHLRRRPRLLLRAQIVAALRRWFEGEGFVEIETAALQLSPGNETHLHAFSTERVRLDGRRERLFLHTSPEFAMKALLAAGEDRIVQFARVFRNREEGPLHAPEFTLVEWYRAGAPVAAVEADTVALVRCAAEAAGCNRVTFRGREADPLAPPERLSVLDAFRAHSGVDLEPTLRVDGTGDRVALAQAAAPTGLRVAADDTWSDVFSRLLSERVEPRLGLGRPTLLVDYPAPEAALARRKPDDPRLSERFELYLCGVELANGFGELTDADEQRCRFLADMDEKERLYGERYPIDEAFLGALRDMPEASGVALGLDRLVMLVTGADRLEEVLWTPVAAGMPL